LYLFNFTFSYLGSRQNSTISGIVDCFYFRIVSLFFPPSSGWRLKSFLPNKTMFTSFANWQVPAPLPLQHFPPNDNHILIFEKRERPHGAQTATPCPIFSFFPRDSKPLIIVPVEMITERPQFLSSAVILNGDFRKITGENRLQ